VLAAAETAGNPLSTPDWLLVEYVGVPPGKNARLVVAAGAGGRRRTLFTEGWPEMNRGDRPIGKQEIEVEALEDGGFAVRENGAEVFVSPRGALSFREGWLYLQLSSHSNYPAREVTFDRVRIADGT
jgi:hypothetical protein